MSQEKTIIVCKKCGAKNRILLSRLGDRPVCGKCRSPLSVDMNFSSPVNVTDQTFHDEVIAHPDTVLVDFWAPWCGPCRTIAPVLEQLAEKYAGKVKIAKLNVDENPLTASQYAVQSIPTMILFKNGKKGNRLVGAQPKNEIEKQLNMMNS
jgi:thioredoxin 2